MWGRETAAARPPQAIFGAEPSCAWCYYDERADLARQYRDWERVVALGDRVFHRSDVQHAAFECLPFIEGYARLGRCQEARDLTLERFRLDPPLQPVICRLGKDCHQPSRTRWRSGNRRYRSGNVRLLRAVRESLEKVGTGGND